MSKKIFFNMVVSNFCLGATIFSIFFLGFSAGLLGFTVHYYNHVLLEPLRMVSFFVGPFYFLVSYYLWKVGIPILVKDYKSNLAKYLGSKNE